MEVEFQGVNEKHSLRFYEPFKILDPRHGHLNRRLGVTKPRAIY